jgi:hypothetical protein
VVAVAPDINIGAAVDPAVVEEGVMIITTEYRVKMVLVVAVVAPLLYKAVALLELAARAL